jgi:hypothetical protein
MGTLVPMLLNASEVLTNPAATTVELERGRFARYVGNSRWESYFESQRGARTSDGPLTTADVKSRFAPGTYEHQRIEEIISAVDGR